MQDPICKVSSQDAPLVDKIAPALGLLAAGALIVVPSPPFWLFGLDPANDLVIALAAVSVFGVLAAVVKFTRGYGAVARRLAVDF